MRQRRLAIAALACCLGVPAFAAARRAFAEMTDGPFYPPAAWRARWDDWDADLTRVERGTQVLRARGEHLALEIVVADTAGHAIDGAEVEIWQCDALRAYRHPRVAQEPGSFDEGFQGFGAGRSTRDGRVLFRTIRPLPYPGRTPHIHVKLRHPAFGERSSQLFVEGDPGNERDFLWRQLGPEDRTLLAMKLRPAPAGSGLRWAVQQELWLPA